MRKLPIILAFAAATAVYLLGLSITVMDVDSAQYASISKEMARTNSFLEVYHNGRDYLDKPPLLFWVNALIFKVFGASNASFKLGALLFSFFGVYSTYRLGKLLQNQRVGVLAALILFSAQAYFLISNDVRTDTMLVSAVVFALWQWLSWVQTNRWLNLWLTALGLALALMAKGPIGLMVPVLAMGCYLLGRGDWKHLFNWRYLPMLVAVFLLISPMLYGLYTQFDAQPEKEVSFVSEDGTSVETGVSGLKFFFWTQSFGRITGENVWKNDSSPLFFVHNMLWSFLPWALLFIWAFYDRLKSIVTALFKGKKLPELLSPLGFLVPFVALSTSQYKLPHYIFVLYPLAAILLASWLVEMQEKAGRGWKNGAMGVQVLLAVITLIAVQLIHFWIFEPKWWIYVLSMLSLLFGIALMMRSKWEWDFRLVLGSALLSVGLNFSMNGQFYPRLMEYQVGPHLAEAVAELPENAEVYRYDYYSFSFTFYRDSYLPQANDRILESAVQSGEAIFAIATEAGFEDLNEHFKCKSIRRIDGYHITRLSLNFLNPKTRQENLDPIYLVQILEARKA